MIWIIVALAILSLFLGFVVYDQNKAVKMLLDIWAADRNKQWIETLQKTGAKIIYTEGGDNQ